MSGRYKLLRNNWGRATRYARACLQALILAAILQGCAGAPEAVRDTTGPDAREILSSIEASQKDIKSFKGIGSFRTLRHNIKKSFRVVWIGAEPQQLRIEALSPWGQPTLTLIVNDSTYQMYSRADDRYFSGDARAEDLSRFISMPLEGQDLFQLLSGQPRILPFHKVEIRASPEDGQPILSLYKTWRRLRQRIWLAENAKVTKRVEVFDGWGRLEYNVVFSDFRELDARFFPHVMVISDRRGPLCSLTVEKFWTGVPVPAGAFKLEPDQKEMSPSSSYRGLFDGRAQR